MSLLFEVPEEKKLRVIIDTDAACEADDPFAIVHALLSPKLMVKGILAEHFREEGSMERSYEEIRVILEAMDMDVPFFKGQRGPMDSGSGEEPLSEGVQFIIEEALKEEEHPLYILCQGAVTNVAAAMKACPAILSRMTVIWIGTHGEAPKRAPFREFNAGNDICFLPVEISGLFHPASMRRFILELPRFKEEFSPAERSESTCSGIW